MKPDWKDAPEWARYLAMDKDGTWWWYEIKPNSNQSGDACFSEGRISRADEPTDFIGWEYTLESK